MYEKNKTKQSNSMCCCLLIKDYNYFSQNASKKCYLVILDGERYMYMYIRV